MFFEHLLRILYHLELSYHVCLSISPQSASLTDALISLASLEISLTDSHSLHKLLPKSCKYISYTTDNISIENSKLPIELGPPGTDSVNYQC